VQLHDVNGDGRPDLLCDRAEDHFVKLADRNDIGMHTVPSAFGRLGIRPPRHRVQSLAAGKFGLSEQIARGFCGDVGCVTHWADVNADKRADMVCDCAGEHHYRLAEWTGHVDNAYRFADHECFVSQGPIGGMGTKWGDVNGDGSDDMCCDNRAGAHWCRLSYQNTAAPTAVPTIATKWPTFFPSTLPSQAPTIAPSRDPTINPTYKPSAEPTKVPTDKPSPTPSRETIATRRVTDPPTTTPTATPTDMPTVQPTSTPVRRFCLVTTAIHAISILVVRTHTLRAIVVRKPLGVRAR
jgi:hypothetical protein